MNDKDGGSAFPVAEVFDERRGDYSSYAERGMTLRDYFAIHCDQPGEAEIATAAGYTLSKGLLWESADKQVGTFSDWWRNTGQQERFRLYAKVRYEMADAMLTARATQTKG